MSKLTQILIVVLCVRSAAAQPAGNIALKLGPNTSTWDRENRTRIYGFSGGLAGDLQWPIGHRFSLGGQTELLYMPRGADAVSEDGDLFGRFRQDYLDVTLAIRPEVRVGPIGVYLFLGGSWSIMLNAERTAEPSGIKDDITDGLKRHDVALLMGGGVALHLPSKALGPFRLDTLFFEVRHDRGLIDFGPEEDSSVKNRTASLMLGVSFALGSSTAARSRDPAGTAASRIK